MNEQQLIDKIRAILANFELTHGESIKSIQHAIEEYDNE